MIGRELFEMPTGRRLEVPALAIRTLPRATPKSLARARETWPEARAEDFTPEGRLFRNADGTLFRRVPGDPGLGGAGKDDVSAWFISHDKAGDGIVYLIETDHRGSVVSTAVGVIEGRLAAPHEALPR